MRFGSELLVPQTSASFLDEGETKVDRSNLKNRYIFPRLDFIPAYKLLHSLTKLFL